MFVEIKELEAMKWEGKVAFGVFDSDGNIKRVIQEKNKVTNYARSYITQILTGTAVMPLVLPNRMELGTGTGTPAATDTDLWSPSTGTLKLLSSTQVYLTYYAQYVCTWQTSDPIVGTWTEVGLKDANGNLWAHAAITSNLTVNSGEMLVGQWAVQILGN